MPKGQVTLEVFGDVGASPWLRSMFGQFLRLTHFRRENILRVFLDSIRMGTHVPPSDGRQQAQLTRDLVVQKLW